MTGQIPQQFIDDLLARADVVEVINRRVPLKKAGHEYKACCPFHDEKTPSFTVSPSKQFFHCFGCGAHGSALRFIMDYERLPFPDAVEVLANELGLDVPREGGSNNKPSLKPLYELLERASTWYARQLASHSTARTAQDYLKSRGLTGEIAKTYGLGYAPPGWNNLLAELGKSANEIKLLSQSGLLSEQEGKTYDKFRNRIMFPILDVRGRTIGFGGRVLDDSTPKYLNSPETPVFHKGSELYGLYQAKQASKSLERLIVVEGYMDVIALAQFGITNAVATLGTAVTSSNLENLFRAAPEVIFCFDGDRAGQEAAWKALNVALPVLKDGRQARFLTLPAEEDPDTWVRKIGADAFLQNAAKAKPLSEALFERLCAQTDMTTIDGRARLVHLAQPLIDQVAPSAFRDMLEGHLRKLVGMTVHPASASATIGVAMTAKASAQRRAQAKHKQPGVMPVSQKAIALLLQHPQLAQLPALPSQWRQADSKGTKVLAELLELALNNPNLPTAGLVEHWPDDDTRRHLGKLACVELELSGDAQTQFVGALEKLGEQARLAQADDLRTKLRPSDLSEEEKARLRALFQSRK